MAMFENAVVNFRLFVYLEGSSSVFRQRGHSTFLALKLGGIFSFKPHAQVKNIN